MIDGKNRDIKRKAFFCKKILTQAMFVTFIALLHLSLSPLIAFSFETNPSKQNQPLEINREEKKQGVFKRTFGLIETFQENFSKGITSTGDKIDTFFGGERVIQESNGSFVRLRLGTVYARGGEVFFERDIKLKIAIPKTKDRLKLMIGDEPEDENREFKNLSDTLDSSTVKEESVGLGYILKAKKALNISVSAGARYHNGVDYYSKVRSRKSFYPGKWELRISEIPFWTRFRGYGATTGIDFERKLGENLFFRASSSATWHDDTEAYELAQNLTLFQQLSNRNMMAYNVGAFGGRSGGVTYVTEYAASIIFRRNIYKNWLFGEIQPRALFQKSDGFDLYPSITARLEVVFGKPSGK